MGTTLDSIRKAADAAYGSYDIDLETKNGKPVAGKTVRLLNALRISADKRKTLGDLKKNMGAEDADQSAVLQEMILLVAEDPKKGQMLLDAVGDDLAMLVQIVKEYGEATQMGEASASRD
jgi:hypothetical protein